MFKEGRGTYYILGVASMHSSAKCDPDDAFIYTSVSRHLDWINHVIGTSPRGGHPETLAKHHRYSSPAGNSLHDIDIFHERKRYNHKKV